MSEHDSAQQQVSSQDQEAVHGGNGNGHSQEQAPTEKPQPDEAAKEAAREMRRTTYEPRPTLVLPGSGGTISGTAINDWLDEDGDSKYADDEDAPAAQSKVKDQVPDDGLDEEQIAEDKAFNERAREDRTNWDEAAAAEAATRE